MKLRLNSAEAEAEALLGLAELGKSKWSFWASEGQLGLVKVS